MADLKIILVESDEFLRHSIRTQIENMDHMEFVAEAADAAAGQRVTSQYHPDVVILEVPDNPTDALNLTEWIRVQHPETTVLGASASPRTDLMRRAMQAGAQDLLPRPLDPGQLATALRHAHAQKLRRLKMQQKRADVTVIFGVGGGIGTTTIATNTAVALARSEPGPVLLADFDMHMSNVACFLDMKPTPTYEDVLKELPKMDVEALRQFLPRHASGLYVLSGPQSIEDLDAIKTNDIAQVLELCSQAFKHVIIDGGHGIDERRTEILDRADRILVVTQLNVATMHSARRTVETLHRLGYDKIHIVANRVGRGTQVTLEDVEVGLGLKPAFSIPNDYPTVIGAIDSGVPIVETKRSGRTAASFKTIAKAFEQANGNGNGSKNGKRRSLLFRKK